jgi:hypothetical protein
MNQQRQHRVCREQPNRTPNASSWQVSPGWSQAWEGATQLALLSGFASQTAINLGSAGRVRPLGSFKDAAFVGRLAHPHPKQDAHPGIRQRTHRDRVTLALRPFALVGVPGPGFVERRSPGKLLQGIAQGFREPRCADGPSGSSHAHRAPGPFRRAPAPDAHCRSRARSSPHSENLRGARRFPAPGRLAKTGLSTSVQTRAATSFS